MLLSAAATHAGKSKTTINKKQTLRRRKLMSSMLLSLIPAFG